MANFYATYPVTGGGTSVDSVNSFNGDVIIAAGFGITITNNANTITVAANALSIGLTSINGDTTAAQTLVTGTSGSDFAIVDNGTGQHTFNLPTATSLVRGALSASDWTTFNNKFDLPVLTSGSILFSNGTTIAQDNTNFFWDNTTKRIFLGSNTSIAGSNAGIQYSDATTANRGQIKLHSYFNGTSIAGVSTLTSRSGVVGTNAAVVAGQDYSKWTAQAGATTPGSAPISGTFAFKANTVNSLTVSSDFHIALTNLAGSLVDRLYLDTNGIMTLSGYGAGVMQSDSSGNISSVAKGTLSTTTTGVTITTGANSLLTNAAVDIQTANTSQPGLLSSADWNTFNSKQAAGNYITALTGDGTASGPGSAAFTLATVNSNVGSFGTASSVSNITVNAKGLITAASSTSIQITESQVTNLTSDLALKAPLASPVFTGVPAAPTASQGNNSTQLATTAYVDTGLATKQATGNYLTALTGDATASGPGSAALTLATVNSNIGSFGSATNVGSFTVNAKGLVTAASSVAIQITESQVTNLTSDLALKAPLASPALTGVPTAPTASQGNNSTQVATTAYVDTGLATKQATGNYVTALTGDGTASGPGSVAFTLATNLKLASISFVIDGGGVAITTGSKGFVVVPYACTINNSTLIADQTGSIVLDIKKSTFSGFPSTTSIVASAPPTLSSAQKSQDTTLTGWTTSIAAGDILEWTVTSATTVTRITNNLKVTKT